MELVNTRVSGEEGGLDHGGGKGDSGAEGECGEGGMVSAKSAAGERLRRQL